MPKFNLEEEDVKALVIFMKSRRGKNFTETELDRFQALLEGRDRGSEVDLQPVERLRVDGLRQREHVFGRPLRLVDGGAVHAQYPGFNLFAHALHGNFIGVAIDGYRSVIHDLLSS